MCSTTRKLNIVVAACNNMGIGIDGTLPWRLKQDMAFFRKVTTVTKNTEKKNMVIMGKNTWLSIPAKFRPLSDRINVVLSSQMQNNIEGAHVVKSFDKALELCDSLQNEVESVFVIGGASVYKEAMQRVNPCRLYITRVHHNFICDTFFPAIDEKVFVKVPNTVDENVPQETCEENGITFLFEVYEKL
ncbi:unnamed protein product [Candidula unifasciata]|uniref:dihydrofolate reductase n=1 Tax=Candidula unifasciata TaxID=100452 RepID=A0A8S3YWS5_9EUPU|nr:unnamed protein product [Candidula unifasciata]